jgi:hypothetical protein
MEDGGRAATRRRSEMSTTTTLPTRARVFNTHSGPELVRRSDMRALDLALLRAAHGRRGRAEATREKASDAWAIRTGGEMAMCCATAPPDDDDALTVHAEDLEADGLTPAEISQVMRGASVITPTEAADRIEMLRREREAGA